MPDGVSARRYSGLRRWDLRASDELVSLYGDEFEKSRDTSVSSNQTQRLYEQITKGTQFDAGLGIARRYH